MQVIDTLLELARSMDADVLVLADGEVPSLEKGGRSQPLSMPRMDHELIESILVSVTDQQGRQVLRERGRFETTYTSAETTFFVQITQSETVQRLVFRRRDAQTSRTAGRELAGPTSGPRRVATSDEPPVRPLHSPSAFDEVLAWAHAHDASDIVLSGDSTFVRTGREFRHMNDVVNASDEVDALLRDADPDTRAEFERTGSVDFAYQRPMNAGSRRYRVNVFRHANGLGAVLRPIKQQRPTLDALNLSEDLYKLGSYQSGLVLVTGPAGSGKSTTLAAIVDYLNRNTGKHIITLEDPIEYVYERDRALVHQREIGVHVQNFPSGLRAALREAPDVILLGEMRDPETIATALVAAETGHLVLATLHASSATRAVERIVGVFPGDQQGYVRTQLSGVLRAALAQWLLPSPRHAGRVPACELLVVNTAVAAKIREGRVHQLQTEIEKGKLEGMISLEQSLAELVRRGAISRTTATEMTHERNLLRAQPT